MLQISTHDWRSTSFSLVFFFFLSLSIEDVLFIPMDVSCYFWKDHHRVTTPHSETFWCSCQWIKVTECFAVTTLNSAFAMLYGVWLFSLGWIFSRRVQPMNIISKGSETIKCQLLAAIYSQILLFHEKNLSFAETISLAICSSCKCKWRPEQREKERKSENKLVTFFSVKNLRFFSD